MTSPRRIPTSQLEWVTLEENVLRQRVTHGHRHQRRSVRRHDHRHL